MELRSAVFDPNTRIPVRYTGEGNDLSPPLRWSGVPERTRELALVCDDPDAPRPEPWVHWVVYGIPPTVSVLEEAAKGDWVEGRNDFGRSGYGGPMPPKGHGVHHYRFRLYALDDTLAAKPGITKKDLLAMIEGHVLAEAELVGTYDRK
ncbi:MAG: YbhB/YbcL family Raf kinase inhibitor-like protein [Candidatus Binatia bacterium]